MATKVITCKDCNTLFDFTDKEQAFYKSKNLSEPKRCKACREKKKIERNSQ